MVAIIYFIYMAKKNKIERRIKKYIWNNWWDRAFTIFFILAFMALAVCVVYSAAYSARMYPGIKIGSFPVGSLTKKEAEAAILSSINLLQERGLIFVFRDRTISVPTVVAAPGDPDLSYEITAYNVQSTIDRAYAFGRSGPLLIRWSNRLAAFFGQAVVFPEYHFRPEKISEILKQNLSSLESPAQDAQLVIRGTDISLQKEKEGIVFNYEAALAEVRPQLDSLIFSPIPLKLSKDSPKVLAKDAEPLLPSVLALAEEGDVAVKFEDKSWNWTREKVNELLELRLNRASGQAEIGISEEKLTAALAPMNAEIDIEPQEPRFKLDKEKVVEFKASLSGRKVNVPETLTKWEQDLLKDYASSLSLTVDTIEPEQKISDLNDLGIKEILGVGKSSFAGSPNNRRHNIRIGAESVNGTLIPPDGEFSLLKTLGTINASTGYLPELVIKGNETVPEFGGGLCQIGTTTFRGTLAAGLPVTARRNHSYTVSYYFDDDGLPGTDATIYDPAPDYRFKNDTGNHVLISTRIEGNNLFFEFWGTKDGRTVEQSKTRIWDRVPPPETKYIETLSLEVGKTKCTETPHSGMKAAFDYKVSYADGAVNKTTYTSQYRPWQEVCLIGVEKLSEEIDEQGLGVEDVDAIDATISN